jgi:uncharacterized protein (DUF1800 family)
MKRILIALFVLLLVGADAFAQTRLINLSTRGQVRVGDNVLIGGFIIQGSTPKKVLVTARGPSLSAFGVPGTLTDPFLQIFFGATQIDANDDYASHPKASEIPADMRPGNSKEAAIVTTLSPGAYTAIVTGVGQTSGIAIVEVFEIDTPANPLVNISTRGRVEISDSVMIAGFVIQGSSPQTVLITARGPSLLASGVPNVLADPKLDLYSGQSILASNDNWGSALNASAIQSATGAPTNPVESAILATLQPGAYTAIVSGVDAGVGIGIVEVFAQTPAADALTSKQAARLLTQASFGPTPDSVNSLTGQTAANWISDQMAMPSATTYEDEVQTWFDKGSSYRPGNGGSNYTPNWLINKYWSLANSAPDQLRRRIVHALMQIFVISLEDSTLYDAARPFGQYLDNLGKHAFGNFRNLIEDVALSPAMGIYLSHIRNQKADPATGRMPDENFAREVMQLFSIGLYQLNLDGTLKLDSNGKPIETYTNDDVVGLARVFTGWSWDMPDGTSASNTFKWGGPGRYATVGDARFDLRPMRIYPSFHETGVKSFLGTTISAGTSGPASLAIALDTLFNHPNVGPFIGKQLIQRLVTSNPSAAYVEAVASAFNNNGSGVRGDMAAVIRTILLHPEARGEPSGEFGKLREPSLRITQAIRAFGASSLTGRWMIGRGERALLQAPLLSPSVFNFYRPGYVPPNTQIANLGLVAPEFQIADETTVVNWINYVWALVQWGQGWTGTGVDVAQEMQNKQDVTIDFSSSSTLWGQAVGNSDTAVIDQIDLLLFSGQMSATLRGQILNAMQNQVNWNLATRSRDKLRIAAFIALTSAEYMHER